MIQNESSSARRSRRDELENRPVPTPTISRRLPVAVLLQPAQPHPVPDRAFRRRCRPVARERQIVLALMRPLFVVVSEILRDDVIQLDFIDHDEVIERFVLQPVYRKDNDTQNN